MNYGLRIVPAADADVDATAFHIAQDSLDSALGFCDAVAATFRKIREQPRAYAIFDLDHPRLKDLRKCSVDGFPDFLIFYRLDADMVEVIRVLHGTRDLPSVLLENLPE